MTAHVDVSVIGNGMTDILKGTADRIYICGTEPTNFTEASSTYKLGSAVLSAGAIFPGTLTLASTGAYKLSTVAIGSGSVSSTGSAYFWAITDSATLLAVGSLSAAQVVTSGNTFTLASFDITLKTQ